MKLGYVSARFPFAAAEQFFEPEVNSLADTFDVVLFPTRATQARNYYPNLRATAHYIGLFDARVAALAFGEFRRAPGAVLRELLRVAFASSTSRSSRRRSRLHPKRAVSASSTST